jgi:GR25 family glycosyltransferase involved in LPS biosynthesis
MAGVFGPSASRDTRAERPATREFIPTYVISLPDAEARRAAMASRLATAGVPFRFFDAVDGRVQRLPDAIDGARVVRTAFKTEAALACTASHRRLHRMAAEGEAETVLILEDDATVPDDIVEIVEQVLAFDFDAFKLEGINASRRRLTVGRVGRYEVVVTNRPSVGAAAYLLRRDAARRICSLPVLDQASDYVFQDPRLRLRVLEMNPFCMRQDCAAASQIAHVPDERPVYEDQWSFDRMLDSTRRKLMLGRIYGPMMLMRLELQRLRPVRTGLAIFRWSIFFAVVIALAVGLWLVW